MESASSCGHIASMLKRSGKAIRSVLKKRPPVSVCIVKTLTEGKRRDGTGDRTLITASERIVRRPPF